MTDDDTDEMSDEETVRGMLLVVKESSEGISLLLGTVSHSSLSLNTRLGMESCAKLSSSQSVNISSSSGIMWFGNDIECLQQQQKQQQNVKDIYNNTKNYKESYLNVHPKKI